MAAGRAARCAACTRAAMRRHLCRHCSCAFSHRLSSHTLSIGHTLLMKAPPQLSSLTVRTFVAAGSCIATPALRSMQRQAMLPWFPVARARRSATCWATPGAATWSATARTPRCARTTAARRAGRATARPCKRARLTQTLMSFPGRSLAVRRQQLHAMLSGAMCYCLCHGHGTCLFMSHPVLSISSAILSSPSVQACLA